MRSAPNVHVEWVGDEAVVLNQATNELHYLNPQSALIYALLLEYGMPDAVKELQNRVDGRPDDLRQEVEKLVLTFLGKGLLVQDPR